VDGIKILSHHSFPSGHSATAFAFCFCIAFFVKKRIIQFFLFILAFLIGFSRVYLSQHFFVDVLFGSLIGITVGYVYSIYDKKLQYKWLDISIVSLIKNNV